MRGENCWGGIATGTGNVLRMIWVKSVREALDSLIYAESDFGFLLVVIGAGRAVGGETKPCC